MILLMRKYLIILFIFLIKFTFAKAEIVNTINVKGNERIAKETIVIFSSVKIGDDLIISDLNKIIKDLYDTDFFNYVSVSLKNNVLTIDLKENKIINSVEILGVKNKKLKQALLDQLVMSEKKSFVKEKSSEDTLKLSNFLKVSGYYFSEITLNVEQTSNNTVNLIYNIALNKKAVIKKINFSGDKVFKSRLLSFL